ncbi:unnamed protein product [Brassica rapa]|uniref:F-box/LRR-repeat protein 15/At3g58940/PEG3-like LRR domain-containing protein n=1 Tax=Brassica campestris TaxID=3711 RepID=A0A8D9D1A3_BRACM|nr:unnamed protein product [Brassica rapa]
MGECVAKCSCLDFDLHSSVVPYHDNQVLFTFLDKLLNFSPELSLLKVKVKCRDMMIDGFMELLDDYTNSVTLPCVEFMPMNLYTSKTLVYLKLTSSGLDDPGFVFMPCLRFLHLEEIKWDTHLEKLLSGCPVLEELALLRDLDDDYAVAYDEFTVMRVRSQSLKSVLSKRWENLYLSVPGLDLDCSSVPYDADQVFLSFIDKLLKFSPESILFKVKVKYRDTKIGGFNDRIGIMIDRGTQHLDIDSSSCICFIDDKTLVYLKLTSSVLGYPVVVFMPCLKFMHLEEVKWRVHLAKLISGCPVLEELTLLRDPEDEYKALLVRTRSLKRFRVLPLRNGYVRSRVKCTLEIDAPGLEHMSLGDDQICSIVVKNLTCLLVVKLDVKFRVLVNTWNALVRYSQLGMIPKFNNLSRLQAVFGSKLLQFLPAFLECCPNLKHLILVKTLLLSL